MNRSLLVPLLSLLLASAVPCLPAPPAFQGFRFSGKNLEASVTLRLGRSEPSAERFYRGFGELLPYFVVLDRALGAATASNPWFVAVDETTVEILRNGTSLVKLPWTATNFSFVKDQVAAITGTDVTTGETNVLFSLQVAFVPAGSDPRRELKRWRKRLPGNPGPGVEITGDLFAAPLWVHERTGGSGGVRYGLYPDYGEALKASEKLGLRPGSVQVVPVVLDRTAVRAMFGRTTGAPGAASGTSAGRD